MASSPKKLKLDTYFKHSAKTQYEECLEAFYFFNKNKMSKEECGRRGNEKWSQLKNDKKGLLEYIEKFKGAGIKKKASIRSFFKTVDKS